MANPTRSRLFFWGFMVSVKLPLFMRKRTIVSWRWKALENCNPNWSCMTTERGYLILLGGIQAIVCLLVEREQNSVWPSSVYILLLQISTWCLTWCNTRLGCALFISSVSSPVKPFEDFLRLLKTCTWWDDARAVRYGGEPDEADYAAVRTACFVSFLFEKLLPKWQSDPHVRVKWKMKKVARRRRQGVRGSV